MYREVSALDSQGAPIDVDPATKEMLRSLGFDSINVNVAVPVQESTQYVP